jgi:membrane protein implicated in regulation of membrane protease activity
VSLRDARRIAAAEEQGRRHPNLTLYGGPILVVVSILTGSALAVWAVRSVVDHGLTTPSGPMLVVLAIFALVAGLGGWLFKRYLDGY